MTFNTSTFGTSTFRTSTFRTWVLAACAAGLLATPAAAHHSFSMFDDQKDMTLEGTVKEYQWTNPHVWIQLGVKDADHKAEEWPIEGASAVVLSRQGWSRKSLKVGDHLQVVVHPRKDGFAGGFLVSATVNGQPVGSHS